MANSPADNYRREHVGEGWSYRYFCAKAGMLYKELSEKSGFSEDHLNKIFSGSNITRKTQIILCRAIGVARWKVIKFAGCAESKRKLIGKMEKLLRQRKAAARRAARKKKKRRRIK